MIENPFFHRGPIRDPAYFYNRKRETKQILNMLSKGQSVSITGPRKIGKTSLLFHISQPEVMQQYGLDPARHLMVYFSCEGSGSLKQEEIYTLILEQVASRAVQCGYSLDSPKHPVSYQEFKRTLRKVCDQKLKLGLLLDEFELLNQNQDLGEEFLSGLRSLTTEFDVAYLTISQRLLAVFTDEYSPFFNIFVPIKIGLFDESESRELIQESLTGTGNTFPPKIVESILRLGGGHPFFLQVAGYWALDLQTTKGYPLESKDMGILEQTVQDRVESHFEYYWKHLSSQEKYVLAALPLTQSKEIYREQLEALAYLCLIAKENGQSYRCFSPLFEDFVRRQEVDDLLQAGPFVLALDHQRVLLRGQPLRLSPRYFALLSYLMAHQGQVASNEELDRKVFSTSTEGQEEYEYMGDERLKSAIKGLRKALGSEADCIVNQRGVGYTFQLPAAK